jgi:hypothetical protein
MTEAAGRMSFWKGVRLEPDARRAFQAELEQAAIDRLRVFGRNGGYVIRASHKPACWSCMTC